MRHSRPARGARTADRSKAAPKAHAGAFAGGRWFAFAQTLVVAGMLVAGYFEATGVVMVASIALVVSTAFISKSHARMGALDWAFIAVGGYEGAALLVTSYRANSTWYAEAFMIAVLVYFVIRVAISRAWQTLVIAAVVGIGGAILAGLAVYQFGSNAAALRDVGLSGVVAFRARLISPSSFILLTLPFSCALPLWLWGRGKARWALIASLAPIGVSTALCLSCSRGVFWSLVVFCVLVPGSAAMYRLLPVRAALLLGFALLGTVGLVLALESTIYPASLKPTQAATVPRFEVLRDGSRSGNDPSICSGAIWFGASGQATLRCI